MTKLLEILKPDEASEVVFQPGETLIVEGTDTDKLYVLKDGEVEVLKNRTPVCSISRKGAAFGEVSALLNSKSTATVIVRKPSTFAVVDQPKTLLENNIAVTLEIARLLAHRVNRLTFDYIEELDDGESVFWANR